MDRNLHMEARNGAHPILRRAAVTATIIPVGSKVNTAMALDIPAFTVAVFKGGSAVPMVSAAAMKAALAAAWAVVLAAAMEAASDMAVRRVAAVAPRADQEDLDLVNWVQRRQVLAAQEDDDIYRLLQHEVVKNTASAS